MSMREAKTTGLLICRTISKKGLKFIEENDPDLHYEIMQILSKTKKGGKSK